MSKPAPKQYLFVSHRDITIGSTQGYSLAFEKGKPMHVPKAMHAEIMEKGVQPCDEKGNVLDMAKAVEIAPEAPKVRVAPEDAEERAERIQEVLEALVGGNNPRDFTAGGVPSAKSVTASLGWKVEQGEIKPLWDKMKPEVHRNEGSRK